MATADYPQQSIAAPASDPAGVLRHSLDRIAQRRNTQRMLLSIAGSLVWAVGICALAVLAYRFFLIDVEWWMLSLPIVIALLIGYRNGQLARGGTFDAALEADRSLGLDERLSSALAFTHPDIVRRAHRVQSGTGPVARLKALLLPRMAYDTTVRSETTQLVPALVHDAAARSAQLDPKQLYPNKLNRTYWILIVLSLLWLAFALMPNFQLFRSADEKRTAATLQTQGKELVAIAKEVRKEDKAQEETEKKRLAKRLEKLGHKMQQGRMTKRDALVQLGQLKKDLEKAAKNDSESNSSGMQDALKALANQQMETAEGQKIQEAVKNGDMKKAAQEMEKLADKIEKGEMTPQEQQKAANDMQKAADALRQQADQQSQQMAQQLEQAAKALQQQSQQGSQNQQGQQSQQNQQGQQGQKGPSQQGQQGQSQSGQQGQSGQGQQGQQGNAQASSALRSLAKSMSQGGTPSGNSQGLKDMLKKIQEAENQTGENSGKPSDAPCPECGKNHKPGGT
jgi:hypothetical protein